MATGGERCRRIEEVPRPCDHFGAARRVVAAGLLGTTLFGDRIGTVQRIVETAPARIGGVQGVARIHHGHHQLGAGDLRELVIGVGRIDREIRAFGHQITDLAQEGLIGSHVIMLALVGLVPRIELGLNVFALGEQRAALGAEIVDDRVETGPNRGRIQPGSWNRLVIDETVEFLRDLEIAHLNHVRHALSSFFPAGLVLDLEPSKPSYKRKRPHTTSGTVCRPVT